MAYPRQDPERVRASRREYRRRWFNATPDRQLRYNLKYWYGLTPQDVEQMFIDQNGKCPGCLSELSLTRLAENFRQIDHDHGMERPNGTCPKEAVRGLLCTECNHAVGNVKDSVAVLHRLAGYLTRRLPMATIDRVGTFIMEVVESTLGASSNGYPQWVARLKALKKYVSDPEEMKHFQIETPGYVDWSAYDESIVAFLVLFSDKGPLRNYEQLMAAAGWDGQDFEALLGFVGKTILARTAENTYKDKTTIQVAWIDDKDAPPERTLAGVDKDKIKELNAKFLANLKKPAAPAKPAVPTKATPAKPAEAAKTEAAAAATPPASTSSAAATPAAPAAAPSAPEQKKTTPPAKKKSTPPPSQTSGTGLPPETTKDEAWEHLVKPETRGANDESVVAEAWVAACAEVGENVDEDRFTPAMWGRVRDIVLKDLGVK